MANLISEAEKLSYAAAMKDIHDTFSRDIIVWKQSSKTIIQEDESYDAFYDKKNVQNTIYTPSSITIKARIKFLERQDKEFGLAIASVANQINVTQEFGIVRIKVEKIHSELVDSAEKVTVDGLDYRVLTVPRPHGLIDTEIATFYLVSLV